MTSSQQAAARLATRLSFLVAGFGIACWAPLIPFAKARLDLADATLGLLLLCIGIGSVFAMVLTGPLSSRFGSRPVIVSGGLGLAAVLPVLTVTPSWTALAIALLAFGAALGSLDVAMNIHAVDVERAADRPLMSGFHALFSVGGFAGASSMTILLSWGLEPMIGTLVCGVIMAIAMAIAMPRLLGGGKADRGPLFVAPRGVVLLLSGLAGVVFLVEGAMLDWGALLIKRTGLATTQHGGVGYMTFAIAMTIGRLAGDGVVKRIGDRSVLFWGGVVSVLGFVLLLLASQMAMALGGFALIGFGASNLVPVLFRKAGAQAVMPSALAVGAITTAGYAGVLVGPAGIGFVADVIGLRTAFWSLAALMFVVPATAHLVAAGRGPHRA
ncbi:MFS transporter [Aurantiacibacter sp. DGU5]|uniref:MFS transporter n=2 Tax=Aurantiacibacter flavus TaxID=3145232 RepID=A0ABV0CZB8_9SPHN